MRKFILILCLLFMAGGARAATYTQPLVVMFGANLTGQAANVRVTVLDSAGTSQIAATNSPSGNAFAESLDAAGNAVTGTYLSRATINTAWFPIYVKYTLVGQAGVQASQMIGNEFAAQAASGVTLSANDSQVLQSGTLVSYTTPNPTATLSASASSVNGYYVGCLLRIVGGQGAGQTRTIIAQTGQVVNIDRPFSVSPTAGSGYVIYYARQNAIDVNASAYITTQPNPISSQSGAVSPFPSLDGNGNVFVSTTPNAAGGNVTFPASGTVSNFAGSLTAGSIDLTTFTPAAKLIIAPRGYLQITGTTTPATAGNYFEDALYNNAPTYSNTGTGMTAWYNGTNWVLSSGAGTVGSASFTGTASVGGTSTVPLNYAASGSAIGTASVVFKGNSVLSSFQPDVVIPSAAQIATQIFATTMQGGLTFLQYHNLQQALSHDAVRTYNLTTHTAVATWYALKSDGTTDVTKAVYVKTTLYDTSDKQIISFTTSTPNVSYLN